MRLLAVGNFYPPHHTGGYDLVWQAAMEHLRARGHAVRVVCCDHRAAGVEAPDDPGVSRELRWYWRDHDYPALAPAEVAAIEDHNATVLRRELERCAPEVVSWWSMGGMSLALLEEVHAAGIPSLAFVADDWLVFGPQVDLATVARRAAGTGGPDLDRLTRCVFVSEATRRVARAAGLTVPGSEVLHHGIDPAAFPAAPEHPWSWRLLHAGRLHPGKGVRDCIVALAALADTPATLTFAGAGDPREHDYLRRAAAGLGVEARVTFLGARTRRQLAADYAAADAVLFPVIREEPWGLVGLEALATGRPLVATGRGGSGEYLRDAENCVIVAPGQPREIADAVRRLAGDARLRARLREAGLRTAEQFTEERFHDSAEHLLLEAASTGIRGPNDYH